MHQTYYLRAVEALAPVAGPAPSENCDQVSDSETERYAQAQVQKWYGRHPEFHPTAKNAEAIASYLDAHGLCPNQANLDKAYEAVKTTLE